MDRREFVTGLALAPITQAVPATTTQPAAGAAEALTGMRAALVTRLNDALRGATCLDLSRLDPSVPRHGWRERVRDAAQQLADCR